MTMKCELTGKMYQSGNNVSHAKNRTKRTYRPTRPTRPKMLKVSRNRTINHK